MPEPKDGWDIAEIIGKLVSPLLIALISGGLLWAWNNQRTTHQTAAAMIQVATGILRDDPAPDGSDSALRDWAIEILKEPHSLPRLTSEAEAQLRSIRLPYSPASGSAELLEKTLREFGSRFQPIPLGDDLQ